METVIDGMAYVEGYTGEGCVAMMKPLNEALMTDRDYLIWECLNIFDEEHEYGPTPAELLDIMEVKKLSDVWLGLEHLQECGIVGLAPKMPNPIVLTRCGDFSEC